VPGWRRELEATGVAGSRPASPPLRAGCRVRGARPATRRTGASRQGRRCRAPSATPRPRWRRNWWYGGCKISTGRVALKASIWTTSKFDRPPWRILPSAISLASASAVSTNGVAGSGQCAWYRSMLSVAGARGLDSTEVPGAEGDPREIQASLAQDRLLHVSSSSDRNVGSWCQEIHGGSRSYSRAAGTPHRHGGLALRTCLHGYS
jgi:hypothetical protein